MFQQQLCLLDDDHQLVEDVGLEENQPMLIESKSFTKHILSMHIAYAH